VKRYRVNIAPTIHDQISEQVLFIAQDSIDNANSSIMTTDSRGRAVP